MSPAKILKFQTKAEREARPDLEDLLTSYLEGNRELAYDLINISSPEELEEILTILKEKAAHETTS